MIGESTFVDELGKDYYVFGSEEYISNEIFEEEYCIGYTVKKETLDTIYKDTILENAKMRFFESTKSNCLLLKADTLTGSIRYIYVNMDTLCEQLQDDVLRDTVKEEIEQEIDITLKNNGVIKPGDSVIVVTEDDINEIKDLFKPED